MVPCARAAQISGSRCGLRYNSGPERSRNKLLTAWMFEAWSNLPPLHSANWPFFGPEILTAYWLSRDSPGAAIHSVHPSYPSGD